MAKLIAIGALVALTGVVQSFPDSENANLLCNVQPNGDVQSQVEKTVTVPQDCLSVVVNGVELTSSHTVRDAVSALGLSVTDVIDELLDLELQHLGEQHRPDLVRLFTPPIAWVQTACGVRHTNAVAAHAKFEAAANLDVDGLMIIAGALKA